MASGKPGAEPVTTNRVVVDLQPDQWAAVNDAAAAFGMEIPDVLRWFITEGVRVCQSVPTFKALPRRRDAPVHE